MPSNEYVHIVTPAEANDIILEKDPVILDVRKATEFAEGHIDGAINLPFDEIDEEIVAEIIQDLNDYIVVYCVSGVRSAVASSKLVELGCGNVYDLADGIREWPFGIVS